MKLKSILYKKEQEELVDKIITPTKKKNETKRSYYLYIL